MKTLAIMMLSLLFWLAGHAQSGPSLPNFSAPPPFTYFSVSSIDSNGVSSAFSQEAVCANGKCTNLCWTAPSCAVSHYRVFWGPASGVYLHQCDVSNQTSTVFPIPGAPLIFREFVTWQHSEDLINWHNRTSTICLWTNPLDHGFDRLGHIGYQRQ
jgi:hypothetical protein